MWKMILSMHKHPISTSSLKLTEVMILYNGFYWLIFRTVRLILIVEWDRLVIFRKLTKSSTFCASSLGNSQYELTIPSSLECASIPMSFYLSPAKGSGGSVQDDELRRNKLSQRRKFRGCSDGEGTEHAVSARGNWRRTEGAPPMECEGIMFWLFLLIRTCALAADTKLGSEVSVTRRLADGEEFRLPLPQLFTHGQLLFNANWTEQEGGGRPLTKGTGRPLSDPSLPLTGPRAFNRVSAPDANSCADCHNLPYGISGGGGDFVTNVFVLGQRFDSAHFDPKDTLPTRGNVDEFGKPAALDTMANLRATTGMFGAGFLEMFARQITEEALVVRPITVLPRNGFMDCTEHQPGQASVARQLSESRARVENQIGHSKSRGKFAHISLRSSAMSSSEMSTPWPAHSPYRLFSGRFRLVPRKLAKSRTVCCLSTGNSRNLATRASSMGFGAMPLSYLALRGVNIS